MKKPGIYKAKPDRTIRRKEQIHYEDETFKHLSHYVIIFNLYRTQQTILVNLQRTLHPIIIEQTFFFKYHVKIQISKTTIYGHKIKSEGKRPLQYLERKKLLI